MQSHANPVEHGIGGDERLGLSAGGADHGRFGVAASEREEDGAVVARLDAQIVDGRGGQLSGCEILDLGDPTVGARDEETSGAGVPQATSRGSC